MVAVSVGMLGTARKLLFCLAFFASAQCVADDLDEFLDKSWYSHQWQLVHPIEVTRPADAWTRPILEPKFREESTLDRLSRLRNLSLLTLSETQKTRVFLGVNKDGLVGLHVTLRRRNDDDRYLELARLY